MQVNVDDLRKVKGVGDKTIARIKQELSLKNKKSIEAKDFTPTKYKNVQLYLGDCLEVMDYLIKKQIKVDAIIADPPYGVTNCKWDTVIPFKEMWQRLKRLRKDTTPIVLFGNEPFSSTLRTSNIWEYKYDWIWAKSNPSNIALANKQPMRYHEVISVFYKEQCTYNKQMIKRESPRIKQAQANDYVFHNSQSEQTSLKYIEVNSSDYDANLKNPSTILEFNSLRPNAKEFVNHPTQKPVKLVEHLIKTYTNKGDTVLDFTMGSGTTGVAAVLNKRKFIGIELDKEYFRISTDRIEKVLEEENDV